jgi:HD-like signal output (HDOD) protein/CheY-like chemotaxis protein
MKWRILFVDDESEALRALEQALAAKRGDWELLFASSGPQALELLALEPCHVILADMHMPGMNGAELLKEVCQRYPKTIRFIVSTAADREFISQFSGDMHQFLAKPCDTETLISTLERTLAVDEWLTNETIKGLVSRMRAFRSLPTLYVEVLKELRSPNASAQAVGEIVAKDLAMSAKMLQIVNSAFYGLQRKITDPSEAVLLLGMDTVQSLVLSIQVYAELDKVKPLYFSMDKLWRHSMAVGHLAKHLTRMVTDDPAMADEAFTAGLFHDIGKLVLATILAEPYSGALALANKRRVALWEVEAEVFGATHAETGAYLLGLWGLPVSVLEASALHHCPLRSVHASFSPLTAVHVANAIEYETHPDKEGFVAPEIDLAYLVRIGWRDELDHWRAVLSGRPMPLAAEAPQPATEPGASAAAAAAGPRPKPNRLPWLIAPAFALVLLLLAGWWWTSGLSSGRQPVAARDRDAGAKAEPAAEASPAPEDAAPPSASAASDPQGAAGPGEVNAAKTGVAGLRLQGVFFSKWKPAALINGKAVYRGELIQGVKVVAIERDGVTLEFEGKKTELKLR